MHTPFTPITSTPHSPHLHEPAASVTTPSDVSTTLGSDTSTVDRIERRLLRSILKRLRDAQKQTQERNDMLGELWMDLSSKIEPELSYNLARHVSDADRQSANSMTSDADGMFTHYYELPADYLHRQQRRQKQITELLALCDDMRGNLHIPSIFVMLSHRWLFDDAAIFSGKLTLARLNLFLKGCNRLFWSDLQQKTVKYRRIYQFIKHDILMGMSTDLWFTFRGYRDDIVSLVAKYFFLYEHKSAKEQLAKYIALLAQKFSEYELEYDEYQDDDLMTLASDISFEEELLLEDDMPEELESEDEMKSAESDYGTGSGSHGLTLEIPLRNSISHPEEWDDIEPCLTARSMDTDNCSTCSVVSFEDEEYTGANKQERLERLFSDIFVHENILLLSSVGEDRTLIALLKNFRYFVDLKMGSKMKIKLQSALYRMWRPGGPYYPSRNVRHQAREMIDLLFPGGRFVRFLVNASFRLIHQYTWPRSLVFWIGHYIWKGVTFPQRLWQSVSGRLNEVASSIVFSPEQFQLDLPNDEDAEEYLGEED